MGDPQHLCWGFFFYAGGMEIQFDPSALLDRITELQRVQIPNASVKAVNQAVFDATKELSAEASRSFSNPVPFTTRAFLYRKASLEALEARVFIRDEASGGNAPSKYLLPQIQGGPHHMTRFQGALLNTVVQLGGGRSVQVGQRGRMAFPNIRSPKVKPLNKYGNMKPSQYNQILSALRGGVSSADFYTGKTVANNQRNTSYIYLDEQELNEPFYQRRITNSPQPGIYFVDRSVGIKFYRVMTDSRIPSYSGKFQFMSIATSVVTESFNRNFRLAILR